jgi:hypothetical protein
MLLLTLFSTLARTIASQPPIYVIDSHRWCRLGQLHEPAWAPEPQHEQPRWPEFESHHRIRVRSPFDDAALDGLPTRALPFSK